MKFVVTGWYKSKHGNTDSITFEHTYEAPNKAAAQEKGEIAYGPYYDYLTVVPYGGREGAGREAVEPIARPTIADEAKTIVNTERTKEYGAPDKNFARIAGAINALYGTDFKAYDVPVIMAIVKLSRVVESPQKRDSWIDLIGYALANELAADAEGRELD